MTGTFESREPDKCPDCVDLWGVHYCRIIGTPCVRVIKCPEGRGDNDERSARTPDAGSAV